MQTLGPLFWHLDTASTREALLATLSQPAAASASGSHRFRLAVVADTPQGLEALRQQARASLAQDGQPPTHADVAYSEAPVGPQGVALLFPGQGAQHNGMLASWKAVPAFQDSLQALDALAAPLYGRSLRHWFFDAPHDPANAINGTFAAQAALGYAGACLTRVLAQHGLRAGWAAGHSYGELLALWFAGACDDTTLLQMTHARGQAMAEAAAALPGTLAAIGAPGDEVAQALRDWPELAVANLNAPRQTVVGGPREALEAFGVHCQSLGWRHALIQGAAAAFHTARMQPALEGWRQALQGFAARGALRLPHRARVVANLTAQPYPAEAAEPARCVAQSLGQQVVSQVRWADTCHTLYDAGVRVFIEVGPGQVLGKLLRQNLGERPFHALSCDTKDAPSAWWTLARIQARLAVEDALNLPHAQTETTTMPHTAPAPLEALVRSTLQDNARIVDRYFDLMNSLLQRPMDSASAAPLLQQMLHDSTRITHAHLQAHEAWLGQGEQGTPGAMPVHTHAAVRPMTMAATATLPTTAAPPATAPGLLDWLRQEVARLTGFAAEAIDPQATLAELGVDSLAFMDLYGRLGERMKMSEAVAERVLAARCLADVVDALQAAPAPAASTASAPGNDAAAPSATTLMAWLREQVAQATGFAAEALDPHTALDELGIDSLARTDLFDRLATRWPAARAQAAAMFEADTLQAIVDLLGPALGVAPPAPAMPAPAVVEGERWTADLVDLRSELLGNLLRHARAAEVSLNDDTPFSAMALNSFERASLWEQTALQRSPYKLAGEALISVGSIREGLDLLARLPDGDAPRRRTDAPRTSDRLQRYRLIEVPRPVPEPLPPGCLLLVTPDGEAGWALAGTLRANARALHHLRWSASGWQLDGARPVALDDASALAQQLAQHLAPLLSPEDPVQVVFADMAAPLTGVPTQAPNATPTPPDSLDLPALPLFVLAKALSRPTGAPVPFDSLTLLLPSATPRHAAARGVARALSHEWRARGTPVTTVTLTHEADPMQALALARALPGRHDLALQAQAASERVADPHPDLEGQGTERLSLDEDSVLLLYGGGVGIAAEVAVDLAQRYHLQVVAIGRTPWQGECPHPALQDPQALQQALLEDLMRQEGRAPEPARLSQLVQQAQRQRELARTAQRVRDAGGRFAYLSADLTSAEAVQACVQDVLRAHGRIDMVVHAAGVVEDRGLATKPVDSFLRVFRTKAHSAWLLRDALRNVPLKYMVFFSSLVSHTGNIGQTDYCAGNEVLNAMASEWAETAPETRVLSVLWSVWHETGLANRAVQQHMQRQGMAGIGNADGTRRLHAELARDTVPDWLLISCPRMFDTLQAGVA